MSLASTCIGGSIFRADGIAELLATSVTLTADLRLDTKG